MLLKTKNPAEAGFFVCGLLWLGIQRLGNRHGNRFGGVDFLLDLLQQRAWLGRLFRFLCSRCGNVVVCAFAEDFLVAAHAWHEVARKADQLVVAVEHQRDALLVTLPTTWLDAVQVIPALGMESVGDQRVAHDEANLALGHSGLQLVYHVLRYDIALLDVDFVDPGKRTAGECEQTHKSEAGQQELGVLHRWVTSTILAGQ